MPRDTILLILSVISCLGSEASGPSADARLDSIERDWQRHLNTVIVTGTRTPRLLKNTPVLTRVISDKEIRLSDATDISDLLQTELPGIEFSYSMNQQVSLDMQGFGGNSVLFLVDGERLAGEALDNVDYSRLDMNNADRIEIVKGGASSLYGSNAVGGVVNIISRDDTETWRVNVNARLGAHSSRRYGATVSLNAGRISSSTTGQYNRVGSYDLKNPGDYTRFYGGYNYNIRERLTVRATDRLRLVGRTGYYFRQRDSQPTTRDRYRDFSAGLRGIYDITDADNLEVAYSFDQYDKSDFLTTTGSEVRKYSNVQNSLRAIYSHTFARGLILTAGGDLMRDYLRSHQFAAGGHRSQTTADGLIQMDISLGDRLELVAGGRYDYFSESGKGRFSSRLSAMYRLDRVNLRGLYSGGFRAPTLKEMYMDFDMAGIFNIHGNPYLRAETSHNFQLSAEYTRRLFNLTVGGFCNLVDNRITTAWSKPLDGQVYTNIGRVDISGLEANMSWRHPCGVGARVSYILTREHVRQGEPYTSTTRPHTATVRLDYSFNRRDYGLAIALNGRILSAVTVDEYTSLTDYAETVRVRYPAYMMWRLNMIHTFLKGLDVTLAIDNLFNYVPRYYYNNSPATTGTTVSAGINIDIDRFFK